MRDGDSGTEGRMLVQHLIRDAAVSNFTESPLQNGLCVARGRQRTLGATHVSRSFQF
jgi:hypothetical protein